MVADVIFIIFSILMLISFIIFIPILYLTIRLLIKKRNWHINFKYCYFSLCVFITLSTLSNFGPIVVYILNYVDQSKDAMKYNTLAQIIEDVRGNFISLCRSSMYLIIYERSCAKNYRINYEHQNNVKLLTFVVLIEIPVAYGLRCFKYIPNMSINIYYIWVSIQDLPLIFLYFVLVQRSKKLKKMENNKENTLSTKYTISQNIALLKRISVLILIFSVTQTGTNITGMSLRYLIDPIYDATIGFVLLTVRSALYNWGMYSFMFYKKSHDDFRIKVVLFFNNKNYIHKYSKNNVKTNGCMKTLSIEKGLRKNAIETYHNIITSKW
uniref:G_PROTEIN_RECEP_F1_2 domain-containing protein n=1 Tax=Rhabditophanes sp. KR3021 TaxID=114890 RepID=A0AC35U9W7_9BILA